MSRWIIIVLILTFAMTMIRIEQRKVELLSEIAFNCGEIAMSLDNLIDLKAEIMADLDEHLPGWAWKEIQ